MNVLLIGSGGREHALAWKIAQSPRLDKLYAAPGSSAIGALAECVELSVADHGATTAFCREHRIHLVVIGPEEPLAAGLADALHAAGVPVFGPARATARLESSKAFAKDFMQRHGIPTAAGADFSDPGLARRALAASDFPLVIKADGLAAGKGVIVCRDMAEAEAAVEDLMLKGAHGGAGRRLIIEECLTGPEVSIMGLCDGKRFLALPPSSDHKRLLEGDRGPNTGGMGVIAPTPHLSGELARRVHREIIDPVLAGMRADGLRFNGVLYCGLMLTADGPKVLEFNVRFGDPETQAVLPLLRCDLLECLDAAACGDLNERILPWDGAAFNVVLAAEGYPEEPITGRIIEGLDAEMDDEALVFHAGTVRVNGEWKTKGGRVLSVTGLGRNLADARERAYAAAGRIRFAGAQYRRDIGHQAIRPMEKTA
ncbi:MAG: phosphoribosylamine--glycine ligase [Elusimicrobiota bacterium]